MRVPSNCTQLMASLNEDTTRRRKARRRDAFRRSKKYGAAATALVLCSTMILPAVALAVPQAVKRTAVTATPSIPNAPVATPSVQKTSTATTPAAPQQVTPQKIQTTKRVTPAPAPPSTAGGGSIYYPTSRPVETARPVNATALAMQEALEPSSDVPTEIKAFNAPKGDRPEHHFRTINAPSGGLTTTKQLSPQNQPSKD